MKPFHDYKEKNTGILPEPFFLQPEYTPIYMNTQMYLRNILQVLLLLEAVRPAPAAKSSQT